MKEDVKKLVECIMKDDHAEAKAVLNKIIVDKKKNFVKKSN